MNEYMTRAQATRCAACRCGQLVSSSIPPTPSGTCPVHAVAECIVLRQALDSEQCSRTYMDMESGGTFAA